MTELDPWVEAALKAFFHASSIPNGERWPVAFAEGIQAEHRRNMALARAAGDATQPSMAPGRSMKAVLMAVMLLPLAAHADGVPTPLHVPAPLTGTMPLTAWEEMVLAPPVARAPRTVSDPVNVPEPSSLALLGAGIVGLWAVRRNVTSKAKP